MIRIFKVCLCSLFSCFLGACDTSAHKAKDASECLGEWKMLGSCNENKSIILKNAGVIEFKNISIEDIACEGNWMLPKTGTWKIVSGGKGIEIWFKPKGGDYGQGGELYKTSEGLEWWFVVGDPDSYEFKKFRLSKPEN